MEETLKAVTRIQEIGMSDFFMFLHTSNPKNRVQPYWLCIDLVFFWCIFKEEGLEETVTGLEVAVCAERKREMNKHGSYRREEKEEMWLSCKCEGEENLGDKW